MKVVSRRLYCDQAQSYLKAMFMFAHELEKLARSCENDNFMLEWCATAVQVSLHNRYSHMLQSKTKMNLPGFRQVMNLHHKVPSGLREGGPFWKLKKVLTYQILG